MVNLGQEQEDGLLAAGPIDCGGTGVNLNAEHISDEVSFELLIRSDGSPCGGGWGWRCLRA